MRALRFDGTRLILDPAAPEAPLAQGWAVIRPRRMGISAFDASLASGAAPGHPPIIPGHECVGVVESVAGEPEVRARWEGKRVVGSIGIVCASCDLCRAGLGHHCRARRTLGVSGLDGCFADRFTLPIRNLVEVPAAVGDDQAVFAEPLAAAAHAAQLVRVEGKTYITVLGDGATALLCAQVFARRNASVRLLGAHASKIALCERWGIKHRLVSEPGRRADQDVVIDATGTGAGLALALEQVRPRGTILLLGHARAAAPPLNLLIDREITLIGSRGGAPADALAMLARADVDTVPLITRRARLADGVAALRAAAEPDQIKVLLEP